MKLSSLRPTWPAALALAGTLLSHLPALAGERPGENPAQTTVRVATFNASLNRNSAGRLIADLSTPNNTQARVVAEIIQRMNPDILLINEFDYAPDGLAAELFRANYLAVGQNGAAPVEYPYYFVAESNTGLPSGFDLDNNGFVGGGNDALGFGFFPGQFGMVIYSKHPIDTARAHLPEVPLEGHARRAAAGQSRDARAGGLVFARRTGGVPPLVQEPLGRAGARPRPHPACAGQPPDPRRCSTGRRTATARATSMKSASGRTT